MPPHNVDTYSDDHQYAIWYDDHGIFCVWINVNNIHIWTAFVRCDSVMTKKSKQMKELKII